MSVKDAFVFKSQRHSQVIPNSQAIHQTSEYISCACVQI